MAEATLIQGGVIDKSTKCGACIWWNGAGCMNWNPPQKHSEGMHDTCGWSKTIVPVHEPKRKKRRRKKGFPPGFGESAFDSGDYVPPADTEQQQKDRERAEQFHEKMNDYNHMRDRAKGFQATYHMRFHEDDLTHIFKDFKI